VTVQENQEVPFLKNRNSPRGETLLNLCIY
jgi:hypothetical protein